MFGDGLGTADLFGCVTCLVVEYVDYIFLVWVRRFIVGPRFKMSLRLLATPPLLPSSSSL